MKLTVSVHRKCGAPGFGSDGAGAELVVDVPDGDAQALTSAGNAWYAVLDRLVGDQVARMQASHQHQQQQHGGGPNQPPPPPDDAGPAGPRRNGPPPRNDGGGKPPENGRQLLAWAGDRGLKKRVFDLKDAWELPDRVVDWGRDDAIAVYNELLQEADRPAPARGYGRNGYARGRA